MVGIYSITNSINNKRYIGQSIDIETRWKNHRNTAFNPNDASYNYPLYKAIRKYGLKNFKFEVLEECNMNELNNKEIFYIFKYNSTKNGYNQTDGGNNICDRYYKISQSDLIEIINLLRNPYIRMQSIADKYNVGLDTISEINNGKTRRIDKLIYPIRPQRKNTYCCDCGVKIRNGSLRCCRCFNISQRKVKRPTKNELIEMLRTSNLTQLGKRFGVSANAIKKWLK